MKSIKKITDIPSALRIFKDAAEKHSSATVAGDAKTANNNFDRMIEALKFLKSQNKIDYLHGYLNHPSIGVRLEAATYLLSSYEEDAVKVLEEIKNTEEFHSFTAEIVLKEWRSGNLDGSYP